MKITEIKKIKDKYEIKLNNFSKFKVLETTKNEYKLYVDKELDEIAISKIKDDNKVEEYFMLALKKISMNDYSPNKIKDFLIKKGTNKQQANQVIKKLKKYSLVNEDQLIENIISFCDSKHYGYNRIIKMLKDREISLDKINIVTYDSQREEKHALEQTKRLVKRYKNKNTVNLKRSVYLGLIRLGFDEQVASLESSKVFNSPIKELIMLKLEYSKIVSSYSRKVKGKELNKKITKSLLSKGYRLIDIQHVLKEECNYEMD